MLDHIYFDLDLTTQKPKIQDAVAEIFAEGCKGLKQLLLYLWRNGIHTTSCCKGHTRIFEGKREKVNGCIGIITKSLTKKQLKDFIAKLYLLNTTNNAHFGMQQGMGFYRYKEYKKDINKSFGISIYKQTDFVALLELFKSVIESEKLTDYCKRLNVTTKLNADIKHFIEIFVKIQDVDYDKFISKNPKIESVDIILACNKNNQLFNNVYYNNGKNLLTKDEFDYEAMLLQIDKLKE